jgi:geranylgeranyl diphosphate synthase, type II
MDLAAKKSELTRPSVELTHKLKTGALIKAATLGAAHLCFANDEQIKELTLYSENLGLAFQVADDLLDHVADKVEAGSYPALVGVDGTKSFLNQLTEDCLARLESWGSKAEPLRELARFNRTRVI